ncbi:MAG: hypothetical protein M3132_01275 [Actinomycetia bacterium]|nr:hypothetical protein [Actinomycetes bacterium]
MSMHQVAMWGTSALPQARRGRNGRPHDFAYERRTFVKKYRQLLADLVAAGHTPQARVVWSTIDRGNYVSIRVFCLRCDRKRRLFVPERWKGLSPQTPCDL